MKNGIGKLSLADLSHAAVNAVIAGVIFSLASVVGQSGFDVFTVDYSAVLHTVINAAFIAFVTSLGRAFGSTSDGKFLGSSKLS